jgi:hypothetical protein
MKKIALTILCLIAVIYLYINFSTTIYVHRQAKSICLWINKKQITAKPAVGPSAMEHLVWLKDASTGNYQCTVTEPNMEFGNPYVCTILISENGEEKIRLNYKLRYKPIYFHHQTNFQHEHKRK